MKENVTLVNNTDNLIEQKIYKNFSKILKKILNYSEISKFFKDKIQNEYKKYTLTNKNSELKEQTNDIIYKLQIKNLKINIHF